MTITRRGLFKGLIGGAAALATPGIVHGEEAVRRYWALDRTHLGTHTTPWFDFEHASGYAIETMTGARFVHEITGQRFPGKIERDGNGRVWVTSGVFGPPGRYRYEPAED
jgi:hypothetical protein